MTESTMGRSPFFAENAPHIPLRDEMPFASATVGDTFRVLGIETAPSGGLERECSTYGRPPSRMPLVGTVYRVDDVEHVDLRHGGRICLLHVHPAEQAENAGVFCTWVLRTDGAILNKESLDRRGWVVEAAMIEPAIVFSTIVPGFPGHRVVGREGRPPVLEWAPVPNVYSPPTLLPRIQRDTLEIPTDVATGRFIGQQGRHLISITERSGAKYLFVRAGDILEIWGEETAVKRAKEMALRRMQRIM